MVFSNVVFLFIFFPAVFALYSLTRDDTLKNVILAASSLLFYAYGEPKAVIIMLFSIAMAYVMSNVIEKSKNKAWFIIATVLNVGLLFVFKYLNFFADCLNLMFGAQIYIREIRLPIGISFFTFQIIGYLADVYRGKVRAQKSPLKLALYISFFPQLIAGPIVKYRDIENQLDKRSVDADTVASGLKRFIFGLSSKLLIANTTGAVADDIFSYGAAELYSPLSWLGAIAYALQIYFDFSGYSNMAIGLGKIFGFKFEENFNLPYVSAGVKEFWRRWHISLSTWFAEYVYIPLGGNRKGEARTIINKLIVFALTGLWHGANFTFIVWGLSHGVFLALEDLITKKIAVSKTIGRVYAILFVIITFVIFRADNLTYALQYIRSMFIMPSDANLSLFWQHCNPYNITIFAVAILGAFGAHKKFQKIFDKCDYALSLALFVLCVINVSAATYNPFIYFRF